MPEPVKVLFVEPPPERRVGGIETCLRGLADHLGASGTAVTRTSVPEDDAFRAADLVHFHGMWEPAHHRARERCRQLGRPFLVSPHGMLEDWAFRHRRWKKLPYFHLIERRSVSRARALLATSELEATTLRQWFPAEQIRTLPLGGTRPTLPEPAAARTTLGLAAGEFVILFLSRCHEKKGLHLLVEALPAVVPHTTPNLHLLIVGEGEDAYVAPLRRATAGWSGRLRCTWAGACWGPEKWNYFAAADLMSLPSYSENFGLAVLESLFAGTPVVTTDTTPWATLRGALPVHIIKPETSALVRALTEAIQRGPAAAGARADTQRLAFEQFAWSKLAPRYTALYRELATPN